MNKKDNKAKEMEVLKYTSRGTFTNFDGQNNCPVLCISQIANTSDVSTLDT